MAGQKDKWEFYTDKKGQHRWRRTASNGNVVGSSTEAYTSKSLAEANAERHGWKGNPKKLGGDDKWEFYNDKSGKRRWRRTSKNGEIVGASSEAYSNYTACKLNAKRNGYKGK